MSFVVKLFNLIINPLFYFYSKVEKQTLFDKCQNSKHNKQQNILALFIAIGFENPIQSLISFSILFPAKRATFVGKVGGFRLSCGTISKF